MYWWILYKGRAHLPDWSGSHAGIFFAMYNYPRLCRGVTHFQHYGGLSGVTEDVDFAKLLSKASDSESETLDCRRLQSGKGFGMAECDSGQKYFQDGWQLREGRMWQRLQNELWELWMSQENPSIAWTMSSSWYGSNFDHYKCPPLLHLPEPAKVKSGERSWSTGFLIP